MLHNWLGLGHCTRDRAVIPPERTSHDDYVSNYEISDLRRVHEAQGAESLGGLTARVHHSGQNETVWKLNTVSTTK
jgi:hypothetical protein